MSLGILLTWFTSYYVIKILVLVIGFWFMWTTRSNRSQDFRLLWYSVGLFLLGEVFCGINIYINQRLVLSFEILHGVGMAAGFSLFFYALWWIIDSRVVHFTDESRSCLLLRACEECDRDEGGCQYERLFGWLLIALAVLAAAPYFSPIEEIRYPVAELNLREVFGTPILPDVTLFPGGTQFVQPYILDFLVKRIYPGIALLMFLLSYVSLRWGGAKKDHLTVGLLAIGLGTLSFASLKLTIHSLFHELAFSSLWEELTELMFIVLVVLGYRLFAGGKHGKEA